MPTLVVWVRVQHDCREIGHKCLVFKLYIGCLCRNSISHKPVYFQGDQDKALDISLLDDLDQYVENLTIK